jgi:rSAM/selenodomain-associated transferase 1
MHNALLVVAKQPVPGQTKTRLSPPLSMNEAADIYECFLRDTLDLIRIVPDVKKFIVHLSEDGHGYFNRLAPDMGLMKQRGMSLGERLDNLLSDVLADGAAKAVVMDSDSPTLPAHYLGQAFDLLETADVVLGPTDDGGYYLIGVKRPQPHLLRKVQMSTPNVLADTLKIASDTGVKVALLPAWYDVDTVEDLQKLSGEVMAMEDGRCRHTRQWILEKSRW